MPNYSCANCGRSDFNSFAELQDHDCDQWTDDDPDGGATPQLVADGGTRTVWVIIPAGRASRTHYHLYEDCGQIQKSIHGAEPHPEHEVDDLQLCELCRCRSQGARASETSPAAGRCGLAKELADADPSDVGSDNPPLRTDGGAKTAAKYTNPTGPGYLGIYTTNCWSAEISIGATTHVDWEREDTIAAVDTADEPGIQLHPGTRPGQDVITECDVKWRGQGTVVTVHPPVLRALDDFDHDGHDIRVYAHQSNSLTIVPADPEPFVPTGGGRS